MYKSKGKQANKFLQKKCRIEQEAQKNLLSEEGIQMRRKRAEFSERVFGQ